MSNNYKISIIIPVYNTEKYLKKCLQSVLKQRFNQDDYEVIIVNDGSKDNSISIINEFLNKFRNCKLINRENRGLLFSRMEAVKKSEGKYILFLDSDDYLPEDTLKKYSNEIESKEYDIIRGNYYTLDINNKKSEVRRYNEELEIRDLKKMYEGILKSDNFNSVWGQVIKKDIITNSMIDTTIAMGEDVEINQNSYLNAKSLKLINDYVYCYRQNPNSLTNSISIDRLRKNIIDIEKVYSKIIENVKALNDKKLIKLSYVRYLYKKNEHNYFLIKNSYDKKIINELIDISFNSKYIVEAKKNIKYKDIIPTKRSILIYLILNNKKKTYINILKLISYIKKLM